MDSDIRTYTIRDPRSNINMVTTAPTTMPQIPPQSVQPARPAASQQPPKSGTSSDNEKVSSISCDKTTLPDRGICCNQFIFCFRLL